MRLQTVITVVTGVLTVVYIVLVADQIDWAAVVRAARAGRPRQVIGALVFLMTGFGLGWVNAAADYSRYLPRSRLRPRRGRLDHVRRLARPASSCWSSACCSPAPRPTSTRPSRADPIGALTDAPAHLVPGAVRVVAVLGLVGGAVLDIYSSGLALLSPGPARAALRRRPASTA